MNKHAAINNVDAYVGALSAEDAPRAASPSQWPSLRTLRLAVGATDFVQTVWVGLAAHIAASGANAPSWKVLCLGIMVGGMAVAMRRAMQGAGPPDQRAVVPSSVRAALSTSMSICAAGASSWLLAPDATGYVLEWFSAWALTSAFLSVALRVVASRLKATSRIVVVGEPEQAAPPAGAAAPGSATRWCVAGYVDSKEPGWLDQLQSVVSQEGVDVVALALTGPDARERIALVSSRLADQPVRVCLAIDSAALSWTPRSLERFSNTVLVDLLTDPHGGLDGAAKRGLDVALSTLALVVLSPLLAAVAVAVRLESPGRVIFRQKRFGLGGRPIEVLKFRSMRTDACDASGEKRTLARDPRVTRVGRTIRRLSIDELPQLINVLQGSMSLVGPRPHPLHMRVGELYYFDAVERYRTRHIVKPGITGWAQVNNSRGEVDTLEKARRRVELDLWYLENWSVWVDLQIIVRTVMGRFLTSKAD